MYFITAIHIPKDENENDCASCNGYFETKAEAIKTVLDSGENDIYEFYFNHVVIEFIEPGLGHRAKEIQWYRWVDGKYTETSRPEIFSGVVNFSF